VRSASDVESWLDAGFPVVVMAERDEVLAWASAPPYRDRAVYEGVREFSVYVARDRRGEGLGRAAMVSLTAECAERGYWKLVSRVFPENAASRALCRSLGFREVGVYRRHARLDGAWRDCIIVELLLEKQA
jgi:L-amino acid N-acyltransferase YncA